MGRREQPRLFKGDEMSTGRTSSLRRRAGQLLGAAKPAALPVDGGGLPPSEDPTRQELKRREAQAEEASRRAARPGATKPSKATGDTFVRRKMRQAEGRLPAWDPDDDTQT